MYTFPAYWPFMWYAMWANAVMGPWMKAMEGTGLPPAAAAIPAVAPGPAAAAGLDPISPQEIGTNAADFR